MLNIGFLVPPFLGHLRPACVLARALMRRGHRVRIFSFPDAAPHLATAGVELAAFGTATFPPGEWDRRVAVLGAAEGRAIYHLVFRLMLDQSECIVAELPGALVGQALDGLIVDQLCYGAESVAQSAGVPLAVASYAFPFHRESRVPLCFRPWNYNPALWARARNRLEGAWSILVGWRMGLFYVKHRHALGLGPPKLNHTNEIPPSLVQVTQIPRFFDFPRHGLPAHFHYSGPWLEPSSAKGQDFPWERLDGRPLIYASLGTLQNRVARWFEMIAAACEGIDAQLVIGLGRRSEDSRELMTRLTDRAVVAEFAPQQALIRRASVVVTHAGLNSALETLSLGAPIVAVPISHDQPGVASRLRRLGVAEIIPAEKLHPDELRSAIGLVAGTPSYRSRAAECARLLSAIDGPELAADVIERAFLTREKVLRIDA